MSSYRDDFGPDLADPERDVLEQFAHRLVAERPVPSPAFRGELGRSLVGSVAMRRRLRLPAVACLASGAALLLVAALGVAGVGPLSPEFVAPQVAQVSVR